MNGNIVNYWKLYTELAGNLESLKDFDEATLCGAQLVRHYPGLAIAWHKYAELLLKAGQLAAADEAFERASGIDRFHPEISLAYAERLRDKKHFSAALAVIEPILSRRPDWSAPVALACEALTALGKGAEGRACAATYLSRFPSSFPVLLALLKCLYADKDPEADSILTRCLTHAHEDLAALEPLAELLLEVGKHQEALSIAAKIVSSGKVSVQGAVTYSAALEATGNDSAALDALERIVSAAENHEAGAAARRILRKRRGPSSAARSKQVLMVTVRPRIREAKLAHALKLAGWETILLHVYEPNYDAKKFFVETHKFNTPEQALTIAEKLHLPIHHVFSLRGDSIASAFVREKLAVTLFDMSDMYDGLVYRDFEFHNAQRYCLMHADGLVCREITPRYACRQGGYQRAANVLYFPEYCWDTPTTAAPKRSRDEVHVVECGWIDIERYSGLKPGNFLYLAEAFARNGVDVHIYQHIFTQEQPLEVIYSDYVSLGKETGRVHVHPNVPLTDIVSELAAYDLGLLTIVSPDGPVKEEFQRETNPASFRGITASRCTDYLEAGLPVVISPECRHQERLLNRYGLSVPLTKELLRNPRKALQPFCTQEMRETVHRKRKPFSLRAQAPRLAKFYERCLGQRGSRNRSA